MNTFLKTFLICLIAALCFIGYKYIGNDSFDNDLFVSKQNPVFRTEKSDIKLPPAQETSPYEQNIPEETKNPIKQDKYSHICYFYSDNGQLTPITREVGANSSLETTLQLLLKGPTIAETKKGIYSEIPGNVDLISVKREGNSIIVNLSSNFGNGGGTQSVENRVKQLTKTIKTKEKGKDIYLHINGKEVEYLGGDGVYIKQPL